jgi:two-component system cell cycle response regulator
VAENIRKEVELSSGFREPLSVSLGISALGGEEIRSEALVDQADRALYQAKSQGRNRAVVFEDWMREAAHAPAGESGADSQEG